MDRRMKIGRYTRHTLTCLVAVTLLSPMTMVSLSAQGRDEGARDQQVVEFEIPAQPLARAIAAWALATGLEVSYPQNEPLERPSQAVSGKMTPDQALGRILTGTGFTYRYTQPRVVTLERVQTGEVDGARVLSPVRIEAAEGSGATSRTRGPGAGNEVAYRNPTTEGTGSYTTGGVTVAGKTPLSLREIPHSISVVTRQQIEDRRLVRLDEALLQVPGVTVDQHSRSEANIFIRGYDVANSGFQLDGVSQAPETNIAGMSNRDLIRFDRVEVRKGADGLLQGAGEPGGTVNLVRKRPQRELGAQFATQAARWNNYRAEGDVTGPLTASGRLRGRLMGAFQRRDFWVDYIGGDDGFADVQLEFDVTPSTVVRGEVAWDMSEGSYATGSPAYSDGRQLPLPRSTYIGDPNNYNDYGGIEFTVDLEHRLPKSWLLKGTARHEDRSYRLRRATFSGAVDPALGENGTTQVSGYTGFDRDISLSAIDANLTGAASFFGRRHELLLGASWQDNLVEAINYGLGRTGFSIPIYVFRYDPSRDAPPPAESPGFEFGSAQPSNRTVLQRGLYGSIRSHLTDDLTAIFGARTSWYNLRFIRASSNTNFDTHENGTFTPYGGLVYDVGAHHSLYGSYADIFRSQATQLDAQNDPLPPVVGAQYEVGIKGEYFGGRLNASAAAFRIREQNRAIADPAVPPPAPTVYLGAGEYRSQGFEIETTGELVPRLAVVLGYTYNDLEITINRDRTGAPLNEGTNFEPHVPLHMAKIWVNRSFAGGRLRGLSIGGGVSAQSKTASSSGATMVRQGAYALVNGFLGYDVNDSVSIGLNINNLLDRTYFSLLGNTNSGNQYGAPREWSLTLRVRR